MRRGGRKSIAAMAVTTVGPIEALPRLDAPYELTDEQGRRVAGCRQPEAGRLVSAQDARVTRSVLPP
jgi:hypothetical protein